MDELRLPAGASARERGRAHGEHFRARIGEIAAIRTALVVEQGRCETEDEVMQAARAHLPVLEGFDRALHDELLGIAEGAAADPASIVVLNHYTDLKDVPPIRDGRNEDEDCSALAAQTPDGPLFGQTWDMHGSVEPYVCMLHVPEHEGRPEAWLFTITGCLALAGMNAAGVGVCINNLKSHDARVGVVWPALVRRMLAEGNAEAALHVLRTAPMSSGHHYLFGDGARVYGVETSGERKEVVLDAAWTEGPAYLHTNHCLSPAVEAVSWVGATSTTHARYEWLERSLRERPIASRRDAWERLGSHDGYPASVCTHLAGPERPHAMKTCGGLILDPNRRELWACHGCVHEAEPIVYRFGAGA